MADADSIQQAAEDIVSQPEYRVPEPGAVQGVVDWVGHRLEPIGDAIGRFLSWLAELFLISVGGGSGGGAGGLIIGWILLAVAAGFVIWFLVRVMPRRRLRSERPAAPTIEQRSRHRTTRREWLEQAAQAEAQRDFTGAVRARYRALAAGLADRHELENDETLTSGEQLRAFDSAPERKERFARATDTYERAWFGEHDVDADDAGEVAGIDRDLIDGRQ